MPSAVSHVALWVPVLVVCNLQHVKVPRRYHASSDVSAAWLRSGKECCPPIGYSNRGSVEKLFLTKPFSQKFPTGQHSLPGRRGSRRILLRGRGPKVLKRISNTEWTGERHYQWEKYIKKKEREHLRIPPNTSTLWVVCNGRGPFVWFSQMLSQKPLELLLFLLQAKVMPGLPNIWELWNMQRLNWNTQQLLWGVIAVCCRNNVSYVYI